MFVRTKETLYRIWAESTIYWDPAPMPGSRKDHLSEIGKAFFKDIVESVKPRKNK